MTGDVFFSVERACCRDRRLNIDVARFRNARDIWLPLGERPDTSAEFYVVIGMLGGIVVLHLCTELQRLLVLVFI